MASVQELEKAFVTADDLSRSETATPEQRARAQEDARAFATELKRQRGLQGVEQRVPVGEFEYAIEKAPKEPPSKLDLAREMATTMTLGTVGQAVGGIGDTDIGRQIGGAAGTGLANVINQIQRMTKDPNQSFNWGEAVSDTALGYAGAGPTLSAARAAVTSPTARALSGEALRQGTIGLAAGNVRKMSETGEPLTLGESLTSFAVPAAGGAASRYALSAPGVVTASEMPTLRSKTLEEGRKLGLKTMPTETMRNAATKQLEKIAGPAALRQEIQLQNASVIKKAMNRYVGVAEDADVTIPLLKSIRKESAKPYEQAGQIAEKAKRELEVINAEIAEALNPRNPVSNQAMFADPGYRQKLLDRYSSRITELKTKAAADPAELKKIKFDMDEAFDAWRGSGGSPELLEKARHLRNQYETASDAFEKAVQTAGAPDLANRLKAARQRIARTYNAEEALNLGDAGYDPKVLLNMLNRGVPLSGEAAKIARFTAAFGRDVAEQGSVGTSGGGMLSGFWGPLMTAGETFLATGRPGLSAVAAVTPSIAKEMATKRLLSEGFQKKAAEAIAPRVFLNPNAAIATSAARLGGQELAKVLTTTRPVTQADIEDLRDNPDLAEEFDAKFGAGQAQKYLARRTR